MINRGIAAATDLWDQDLDTISTPGGVYDLRTGEQVELAREAFPTMKTAVEPAPTGIAPIKLLEFLGQIFDGDREMIDFFQVWCGVILFGHQREEKLLFAHGSGRNGKSVLFNSLLRAMGSYGKTADSSMLTIDSLQQHRSGVASLRGKRLAVCFEIPEGVEWNTKFLIEITGGDWIEANHMRGEKFNFLPQLSLNVLANNRPAFRALTPAVKARMIFLPFEVTFADREDRYLEEKLAAELPAIFRWMMDGAVANHKNGLTIPARLAKITEDYLNEADTIAQWYEEVEVADDDAALFENGRADPVFWHKQNDVVAHYQQWCRRMRLHSVARSALIDDLAKRGIEVSRIRLDSSKSNPVYGIGPLKGRFDRYY